ncbi:polycomb group protein EMBRYONIC FLOWER 2 [Selaginella moellendorffii]|nr:polycomb group protein EMBRYONIC FLOWER 2 [Selaginella moellendorffii]|eukprot:XP_002971532.2 polycomb group protein EMBRYONIC FLOWER 2 [Selaginella moellendorffii]
MTLAESSRPSWPNHSMDLGKDMERMAVVDQKAAQESLYQYCKPVELYNIIQRRAIVQPIFLQRSLSYKIQARRERRCRPLGRVIFHYLYYFNRLRKIEATENFSCPFCLACCWTFKGLRCHLDSSHDRFNFEYSATGDIQAVIVTCKSAIYGFESIDSDIEVLSDPRLKSFYYCSHVSSVKRQRLKSYRLTQTELRTNGHLENGKTILVRKGYEHSTGSFKDSTCTTAFGAVLHSNGHGGNQLFKQVPIYLADGSSQRLESQLRKKSDDTAHNAEETRSVASTSEKELDARQEFLRTISLSDRRFSLPPPKKQRGEKTGEVFKGVPPASAASGSLIRAGASRDGLALLPPKKLVRSSGPRVEKSRKVTSERAEARNRALLLKRQFFHAHTGQPMASEQLLSDKDSEDELDDAIASLEDCRMLDDFVDVTKDEKDVMHRWNDFVRRQRVIADGHCPWACQAFVKLHAEEFRKSPSLRRCFMFLLVKFWNNHLIDGQVMNDCLSTIDVLGH